MESEEIAIFLLETIKSFEAKIDNDLSDMEKFELTKEDLLDRFINFLIEQHQ
mgnify:CR=1 FL=1